MNIEQFFDYINGISGERPKGIRLGQFAYNLLYFAYPHIGDDIVGKDIDPFYVDSKVPAFLAYILNNHIKKE